MAASPSTPAPLSRAARLLAIGVAAASLMAVIVPVAHAADAHHLTSTGTTKANCAGDARGSGQMDAAGWMYTVCDNPNFSLTQPASVQVFDAGGVLQFMVPLSVMAADVAPSPDGNVLYVTEYPSRIVRRYVGSKAAKTFTRDAAWKVQNLPGSNLLVRGEYVATDQAGDVYVSSGIWDNAADKKDQWANRNGLVANTIVKYRADGTYVTNFGVVAGAPQDDSSWDLGVAYDEWAGLAVTANGGRVFVADKLNSRVHRFDVQNDGTYQARLAFGNSIATAGRVNGVFNRDGSCYQPGLLAAPYDLALSAGGEVLVVNTSCYYMGGVPAWDPQPKTTVEIQRFGQDGGSRGVINAISYGGAKAHGIAVDRVGTIHLPQANVRIAAPAGWSDAGADVGGGGPIGGTAQASSVGIPTGPIPGAPDTAAPIITSVTATQVGYSKTVQLSIVAADDRGIVDVRTAEDKKPFAWRGGYAPTIEHTFDTYGTIWVAVMVADAAGNASAYTWTQAKLVPAPAVVAPPVVAPVPAPSAPVTSVPVKPGAVTPVTGGVNPTMIKPGAANAGANGGGPQAAGGAARPAIATADPKVANASAPIITAVKLPPNTTTGRVSVRIAATDPEGGKLFVRLAGENGRWGKLRPIGSVAVPLSKGAGWKGVFIQVVDAQGNRSRVYFQTILSAPRTASWIRGSKVADKLRGSRRADHIDLSRFDDRVDSVSCGAGFDTVLLQPGDAAAKDCEKVVYLRTPAS